MDKKFINNVLNTVATQNEGGFVEFTFAPEFEKTEESVKVLAGIIVKSDFKLKKSFKVSLLIVKHYEDKIREQEPEFVDIEVLYSTILDSDKKPSASTYAELSLIDLFRKLEDDEIISVNLRVLSQVSSVTVY